MEESSRYLTFYEPLPLYDVLAALWNGPASDADVAHEVEGRSGEPCSRNAADQHLRLLRSTGHVATRNAGGISVYALTDSGSALLSQLAGTMATEARRSDASFVL
jgi:hypothetical protein